MPSRPSPGSDPRPVQVPSWVRRGPVQIRHVLCFVAFRTHQTAWPLPIIKNLLMPLFLMGCFPVDFQDVKRRPIKVGKRPINEGKRPIKAKVLVGVSVGSLMGCFRAPPPWRKTAPLKRPIKKPLPIKKGIFCGNSRPSV